jgi:glycogen debranching enzyme
LSGTGWPQCASSAAAAAWEDWVTRSGERGHPAGGAKIHEVEAMPAEISVGSPVLTINQGSTFMVTDLNGEIDADSEAGVFANDTRFVSYDAILANGQPWRRLTSAVDDWRDAEPGKMPHEIRFGELAPCQRIPHTPYYGTADATSLYLIAWHEAWQWLGEAALLREYREVALRCLAWIDHYGDLDGDGYQAYRTRSPQGYEHRGWNDAGDAVIHPDGRQVKQPKALCELQGDVFDAWRRTAEVLAASHPAYHPFAYQRGSVWTHDNGIIALGFTRDGCAAEAARVFRDLSEAASDFVSYRLRELYARLVRCPGSFPVQYRGANVPQAWAAGSVFHLLQAILGLQADAPHHRLFIDPQLPRWLPEVTLRRLTVGQARLDLRCWREGDRTRWEASVPQGELTVQEQPWAPWRPEGDCQGA